MMENKMLTKKSKFLSLILRHRPNLVGIVLDENGWVAVDELLQKVNEFGEALDLDELRFIAENNNKKRFAFSEDQKKIRANQGHSVKVDLKYGAITPPEILYHGTAEKYLNNILHEGLKKRKRHHVHLSADLEVAKNVGRRHGKLILLEIFAKKMHSNGMKFFQSENGVWLTEKVPVGFFREI